MRIRICTRMCTRVCICGCMRMCIRTCAVHMHVYAHVRMYAHVYAFMCLFRYMYTHVHMSIPRLFFRTRSGRMCVFKSSELRTPTADLNIILHDMVRCAWQNAMTPSSWLPNLPRTPDPHSRISNTLLLRVKILHYLMSTIITTIVPTVNPTLPNVHSHYYR